MAEELICEAEGFGNQLTIHADRGSSFQVPAGVSPGRQDCDEDPFRVHTFPNDNAYLFEARFKTLKYRPGAPAVFWFASGCAAGKPILYLVQPRTSSQRFGFWRLADVHFPACTDGDSKRRSYCKRPTTKITTVCEGVAHYATPLPQAVLADRSAYSHFTKVNSEFPCLQFDDTFRFTSY